MKRASEIKLADLKSFDDCLAAIKDIESHWDNVIGGQKAFFSGWTTELTQAAKNKIAAIEKRMDKFVPDIDD